MSDISSSALSLILYERIALPFYRNAVVFDIGLSAFAGTKDDVNGISFGFRHIAFVEFLFVADLYDLEAFPYKVGGKLPQFFKAAVAVEDCRKIFDRVVCGDSEVV